MADVNEDICTNCTRTSRCFDDLLSRSMRGMADYCCSAKLFSGGLCLMLMRSAAGHQHTLKLQRKCQQHDNHVQRQKVCI